MQASIVPDIMDIGPYGEVDLYQGRAEVLLGRQGSVVRSEGMSSLVVRAVAKTHLWSQMMDESARLMTTQLTLEKESDGKIAFFGQSVNETIRTCLINGMAKRADKVKSDFKVPDKRSVVWQHDYYGACLIQARYTASGSSSSTL